MVVPLREELKETVELVLGTAIAALGGQAPAHTLHGGVQSPGFDRLEQVVNGVDFECLDRVLVECGDEHELGAGACIDKPPRDLEAGDPRHLNVEHHQVRVLSLDGLQCFQPVSGLPDDLHTCLAKQEADFFPRQLLVVHHNGAESLRALHATRSSWPGRRAQG